MNDNIHNIAPPAKAMQPIIQLTAMAGSAVGNLYSLIKNRLRSDDVSGQDSLHLFFLSGSADHFDARFTSPLDGQSYRLTVRRI